MFRILSSLLLLLASCSEPLDPNSGSRESRELEAKPDFNYASLDGVGQESKFVAGIDYDIEVKANSGFVLCRGQVTMFLRSSFALEFPDSVINCASAKIDITKILSGLGLHNPNVADDYKAQNNTDTIFADGQPPVPGTQLPGSDGGQIDPTTPILALNNGPGPTIPPVNNMGGPIMTNNPEVPAGPGAFAPMGQMGGFTPPGGTMSLDSFSSDGMVLYTSDLLGTRFEPPRPLLLGPLIVDPSKYAGYETVTPGSAIKNGVATSGIHKVTVLEIGGSYINDYKNVTFNDIIHWRIKHEGFKELSLFDTFLPERLEVKANVNPIMIPEIKIVIPTDNLFMVDLGGLRQLISGLLGNIHIHLKVNNYKFKEDQTTDEQEL